MTVDELSLYDVVQMSDEEIRGFLSSHSVGVLGFSTEGAPSLRPMSFWFDGESGLYLLYVGGDRGRKAELTARSDAARFLVYTAETTFTWRSVLLTGTVDEVPDEEEEETIVKAVEDAWRPEVLRQAVENESVRLYRFTIEDQHGIKSMGLPPGFEDPSGETRS
jgi:nitroimidazol reductase NimA-like FMN-containing flavoprotein (pyridoxamine 5'-phosphate oxidase superfamily)